MNISHDLQYDIAIYEIWTFRLLRNIVGSSLVLSIIQHYTMQFIHLHHIKNVTSLAEGLACIREGRVRMPNVKEKDELNLL
jgi:uncharacterized membrane protein